MIFQIVDNVFTVYLVLLFVRILSSWVPELSKSRFMLFVSFCTDPYLNFFRKFIPPLGMLDLSPMVAFFCLQLLQGGTKTLLAGLLK